MSYKCGLCYSIVPSGEPLLKHVQYKKIKDVETGRMNQQVMNEIPVCGHCNDCLVMRGMTVFQIINQFRPKEPHYPDKLDERTVKKVERLKKEKIPFKYTVENGILKIVELSKEVESHKPKLTASRMRRSQIDEQRQEITNEKKEVKVLPLCDVCGSDASDGQVLPESILCHKHLGTKRKGRMQR